MEAHRNQCKWVVFIAMLFVWCCVATDTTVNVCDSGDLYTVCIVNSTHEFNETKTVINGSSLVIATEGILNCTTNLCTIQIIMNTSVSIVGVISGGLIQIESPAVTVESTGLIDVSEKGYGKGEGLGGGNMSQGGAYAGWSSPISCNILGTSLDGVNQNFYGNIQAPTDFGSGGGGGSGGGAILINATTWSFNGQLLANGEHNVDGGGSGGSIYVIASTINFGYGVISANGGSSFSNTSGGGSGGRISMPGVQNAISALGGSNGDTCASGAYGTIYDTLDDSLYLRGYSLNKASITYIGGVYANVFISDDAQGFADTITADQLSISSQATLNGLSGSLYLNISTEIDIDGTSYINVESGGTLTMEAVYINILGMVTAPYVNISATQLVLSGTIDVSALGYPAGSGPGAGANLMAGPANGASYGGYSYTRDASNFTSSAYGSFAYPTDMGSGGGSSGSSTGGAGGGLVHIHAAQISFTGYILANGADGQSQGGGGSGGSVFIKALHFPNFNGSISANGGDSTYGGYGGGGRIAINTTSALPNNMVAIGGGWESIMAGAGTIYLYANDTLIVDNNVQYGISPISLVVTGVTPLNNTFITNLLIRNAGIVQAIECGLTTSDITITRGSIIAPNCQEGGNIVTSTAYISYSSTMVFRNWWRINVAQVMQMNGKIFGSGLIFTGFNFSIRGAVSTDGLGYGPALGPGAGQSGGDNEPGGGAGYGSAGMSSCGAARGGDEYGTITSPFIFGSGGGNSATLLGGAGGGSIIFNATYITLHGTLSANGLDGASGDLTSSKAQYNGAGGGSGGSISATSDYMYLDSNAVISANGGNGGQASSGVYLAGGGGSGGRLYFNVNTPSVVFYTFARVQGGVTWCKSTTSSGTIMTQCSAGNGNQNNMPLQCTPCRSGTFSINGTCLSCSPGTSTYGSSGQTTCTPCIPGYIAPYSGAALCTPCAAGQFTNTTGQITCLYCPPGTSTNLLTGQTNCTLCKPGFSSGDYQPPYRSCYACSNGQYSNTTGATTCSRCSSGYASGYAATNCTACGPGTMANSGGCTSCVAGRYSNETANQNCYFCPAGYISRTGATNCTPCDPGYTSTSPYNYCSMCQQGSYNNVSGGTCHWCPSGTYTLSMGSTSCVRNDWDSDSDDDAWFLWWAIPILFVLIVCIPAIWCWRRNRIRAAYQQVPEAPRVYASSQSPPVLQTSPYLPPVPPQRTEEPNQNDNSEETQSKECIICCDAKKDVVLLPCGHIASCEKCTRALLSTKPQCPICRNTIMSFVRMYSV